MRAAGGRCAEPLTIGLERQAACAHQVPPTQQLCLTVLPERWPRRITCVANRACFQVTASWQDGPAWKCHLKRCCRTIQGEGRRGGSKSSCRPCGAHTCMQPLWGVASSMGIQAVTCSTFQLSGCRYALSCAHGAGATTQSIRCSAVCRSSLFRCLIRTRIDAGVDHTGMGQFHSE